MPIDLCKSLEPGKSVPLSFAPGQFALNDTRYLCICPCHTTKQNHTGSCCVTAPCGAKVVTHCLQLHKNNCKDCRKMSAEKIFMTLNDFCELIRQEHEA